MTSGKPVTVIGHDVQAYRATGSSPGYHNLNRGISLERIHASSRQKILRAHGPTQDLQKHGNSRRNPGRAIDQKLRPSQILYRSTEVRPIITTITV